VPVSEALISLSNVDVVWYVSSPSNLTIAEEEAEEETTEEIVEIRSYPLVSLEKMDLIAD
jgi:hypothetical protein